MLFRFDQLGKNILRDFFDLLADAQTEVEVPPGDAQHIDLWLVPDPERLKAHPEIPAGLLRSNANAWERQMALPWLEWRSCCIDCLSRRGANRGR